MTSQFTAAQAAQQSNRDGGGKYATKDLPEEGAVDLTGQIDSRSDDEVSDEVHGAALAYASDVNNEGVGAQIRFLHQMGYTNEEIEHHLDEGKQQVGEADYEGALDDTVIDECSQYAFRAYNNEGTAGSVTRAIDEMRDPLVAFEDSYVSTDRPDRMEPGQAVRLWVRDPLKGEGGHVTSMAMAYTEKPWTDGEGTPSEKYRVGVYTLHSNAGQISVETDPIHDHSQGGGDWERETAYDKAISETVNFGRKADYFHHDTEALVARYAPDQAS